MINFILVNAGIPMLVVLEPVLLLTLLPVVLLETWVLRQQMQESPAVKIFWSSLAANLISTLIGVPLFWAFWTILMGLLSYLLSWFAPTAMDPIGNLPPALQAIVMPVWLAPYEYALDWTIPLALLVLFVPAYGVSAWMEAWIMQRWWAKTYSPALIRRQTWRANRYSYMLLGAIVLVYLVVAIFTKFIK
ncbi:MAG: hypothetical protein AAFP88_00245 [Bacteroidota bacterium]